VINDFSLTQKLKEDYLSMGYCVFNIGSDELIDSVNDDIAQIIAAGNIKTNSKIYSYNDSPRLIESWKFSENCKKLVKHSSISKLLRFLYDDEPRAFSTINFLRSTEQPLHSDYVHFGTVPELRLAGSWIALEDIDPRSGPLAVVPGSHKLPIFDFQSDLGLGVPRNVLEVKEHYILYEQWVIKTIKEKGLKVKTPSMKKGDCIIWDANLLHGSPVCIDNRLSRRSQVIHWDFSNVVSHYNPNFSNRTLNKYATRAVEYI
jgi:hypothetical protein